jgi:3-hydroxyacyl-[acyl-carrier-protein] dehydratase
VPSTIVQETAAPRAGARAATPIGDFVAYEVQPLAHGEVLVRARQAVDPADPHLAAHFPTLTVYPGVFLLESVFHAASGALGGAPVWSIATLKSMRFRSPVLAGDWIDIEATVRTDPRPGRRRVSAICRRGDGVEAAQIALDLDDTARAGDAPGPDEEPAGDTAGPDAEPSAGFGRDDHPMGAASLDPSAIRSLLPHGHPMLLVDRLVALEPGRSGVGVKAVTLSDSSYSRLDRDVAPRAYAYPTSLLLESFGQTAALVWLAGAGEQAFDSGRVLMLALARDCEVEGQAMPGDSVRHVVWIDQILGDNVFVAGESFVGERRIVRVGSMMAVLRPRDSVAHVGDQPAAANGNGKNDREEQA